MKTVMIMVMTLVGAHASVLALDWDYFKNEGTQRRCCCWRREQGPVTKIYVQFPSGMGMWMKTVDQDIKIQYLKQHISCKKGVRFPYMYVVKKNCFFWTELIHVPDQCHLKDAVSTYGSCTFRVSSNKLHKG